MTEPTRYLITAALPYANGPVHIGHIAGCYLPADIYVRYLRSNHKDVKFICGSDEHGVPIKISAQKEGITPQQVADRYHAMMKNAFSDFGISFDIYSRTTNKIHHETAQDFFSTLYKKGAFIEEETEQYFDEKANQFLADRYITGTCPKCGNENAYGDQCEKCGSTLNPTDLIHPRSTLSDATPVLRKTKNWSLPLDKLQPKIEAFINAHPEWKTNVLGQCKSWISGGLQPRAMTRDLDWGVKVPLENTEGKVLYVWFDAPIGYISATKELTPEWEVYWKSHDTKLVHFIGKDNIVFHCIIFPAMLMEHGGYILPENVPANEFLNLEGNKISTSKNWAVWLHEYISEFKDKQDVLRYTLTSIAPETKDSEFTWKDFQLKNNSELVAILGNLVNRVVVLTHKFFEGKVPQAGTCSELEQVCSDAKQKVSEAIENYKFREAQNEFMNLARHGNKLLTEKEPWKLVKEDKEAAGIVLYDCFQIIANLAIIGEPFLPFTAQKINQMMHLSEQNYSWSDAGRQDLVKPLQAIAEATLLFDKIEDDAINFQTEKLHQKLPKETTLVAEKNIETKEQKSEITFDDFAKVDLRIGTILTAERVPKADKLLKFSVDMGFEVRTILSGIAEHFTPEETIGKQVTVVTNLAPRKIRGEVSNGMILLAENTEGKLVFVSPEKQIQSGAEVR